MKSGNGTVGPAYRRGTTEPVEASGETVVLTGGEQTAGHRADEDGCEVCEGLLLALKQTPWRGLAVA